MADAYGINDVSLLSGPNADTARMIRDAFTRSMLARDRQAARYSLPQLSSFNEDNALAQAQSTAGILNNNQQLQNLIDASHHTPHGIAENLSAYLPLLGGAMRLLPGLFGTDATSAFARKGLVGTVKSWFKDPNTGQVYGMDGAGKVVTAYDAEGNVIPGYGQFDRGIGGWPGSESYGQFDRGIGPGDWTTGFGGDSNFGAIPSPESWWSNAGSGVDAGSDFGSVASDLSNFFG